MTNRPAHDPNEEIERIRGVLTRRFMISGAVTPRVLALSQYLDSLIADRQKSVLTVGSDRVSA